eukprot:jgi/Bigna1/84836/estExt_fgenesh1_pg.C_10179
MLGALRKRLAKQGGYALSQFSTSSSPQFKAMIMLKRKEGIERSEFEKWWLTQHKGLALQLPGLKKYAVSLVDVAEGDEEPMYDGVAELWFDKKEDLAAAYETKLGSEVAADSMAMVCKRDRLLTYEHVFEPDS